MVEKKDISETIHELQSIERNMQAILQQKQIYQQELGEVMNALNELENYNDSIYKVLSGIMLKVDKSTIQKELSEKKSLLNLKMSSLEKQESFLENKEKELKKDIMDFQKPNKQ